ncbi:MAG: helix-turn-helix transcriptional regulator [Flavobacterium sp.]|jgi:transcriptional regulator with XRE-family HTH domain|uniref:helix-turn-helix domain-containing protein n=1 Tax=Flavobacterium sp. TaxID=239 RepID=UPI0022C8BE9A|nr:helix-turn-helix transcriptional regulator [Flavobacterium sp.]MCZ8330755.1 helix-turn-helix transcriptional regulator [Flavobacterium sp.]
MNQPELGKKILELRLAKGLTQSELAEKSNVSLKTIQRIELAKVIPRSYSIKSIFSVLEYDFYNSNVPNENEKTSSFKFWIINLFNLKNNTMKKLSFLTIVFIAIFLFMTKNESQAQNINGWFKTGSKAKSYEIGLNSSESKTGKKCAFIRSIENEINGFGALMQKCDAKIYLGKRVKMTGYLKAENVENWSGMWLRVDSKYGGKSLSFDNMKDRAIKGTTEWIKCEIILNVPNESSTLNYGVLLNGKGMVYFDRVSFEILGNITDEVTVKKIPEKPSNIDFED